ncbi:Uncharacterized protein DBV05_g8434 [Lasiodiplodia theobromae]|uniref:Steroid 5-alpha reductase C-terminal domain-containing protein n=1 Tax=Lasiodiplodia theobromae TaxID=45133 RepID=A0A5N5D6D4_9PEZI|nr:Uncharacterized protein DBV05_g8434 [Lasiodiplodia theobromae]
MPLVTSSTVLPAIKSLADCADWSKTVEPFIPQLKTLPYDIAEHVTNLEELKAIYVSTNPLISGFAFSLAIAPLFLLASEINRNYSQVDRFWSLLPTVYNAHFSLWAHLAGVPSQRVDNVLAFSMLWSIRLTYNYWRKGGYSIGSEDYRWAIIKSKVPAAAFFLFNVTFISTIQSVLLFAVTAPTYILLLSSNLTGQGMGTADIVFSRILIALVVIEWFADQQQWNYQTAKHEYLRTAVVPKGWKRADLDRGFCVSGLWAYSRHPNFAAEQAIWVVLYQWASYDTEVYMNWAFAGAMSYLLLFVGSTWLTELLTAGKYPEYKEYQKQVGKFMPSLLHGGYKPPAEAAKPKDSKNAAGKKK